MKIIGVIPARYGSSRFEGKPLKSILDKPMVWWVYHRARMAKKIDDVYVATDDVRIEEKCKELGINVVMTSTHHRNGTERIAEVASKIKADYYIDIQGDEPLLEPDNIDYVAEKIVEEQVDVIMLKTVFKNPVDVVNTTTAKIVSNIDNDVLYISRMAIPYPKSSLNYKYFKALGLYAFTPKALEIYKAAPMGEIESIEEIELLRMIENNVRMKVFEVDSDTVSVDTPKDLDRVRQYIIENIEKFPFYQKNK